MSNTKPKTNDHNEPNEVLKTIKINWRKQRYEVTREQADNLEMFEAIEDKRYLNAMKQLLGEEQWERFKALNRNADGVVSMSDFNSFLNAAMAVIGSTQGGNL